MPINQFGEWYNDGTDDPPDDSGYGYDMSTLFNSEYMQPQMPGQNYSTAKWNFGDPQAIGQNTFNQWITGQKGLNALQTSPMTAYNAMVAMGVPTMSQNSLMGLDSSGMPYQGSGGSGGGGANGYNPNFVPSTLRRLQNAPEGSDSWKIWQGIQTGQDPLEVKKLFLGGDYDPDTLAAINKQVDDAYNESALMERNDLAGMNQPAQQTPIQKWMDENGLINPMETYNADNLPPEVDPSGGTRGAEALMAQATGIGKGIKGINDERRGLEDKAKLSNLVRTAQLALLKGQAQETTGPGHPYVNPSTGAPVNMAGDMTAQRTAITPRDRVDTGAGGGWAGAFLRPIRDAVAQRDNPGGDVDRMSHLRRQSRLQEGAKRRTVEQAQGYDQAYRAALAGLASRGGRTPARDAQRAIYRYMQQGGMPA